MLFHYITNELTGAEGKFNLKEIEENKENLVTD